MTRRMIAAAPLLAGLLCASQAWGLNLQTVDSRGAWENAFRIFNTETFSGLADALVPVGGGTLTGPADFDIMVDEASGGISTGIIGGRFIGEVNSPTDSGGNPQTGVPLVTTLKFDGSIYGFAASLLNVNTGGLEVVIGGETFEVPDGSSFFGVVAKPPAGFDMVDIRYNSASANRAGLEQFLMDNISIGVAPVPEPVTGGLGLAALGALVWGAAGRRRG